MRSLAGLGLTTTMPAPILAVENITRQIERSNEFVAWARRFPCRRSHHVDRVDVLVVGRNGAKTGLYSSEWVPLDAGQSCARQASSGALCIRTLGRQCDGHGKANVRP